MRIILGIIRPIFKVRIGIKILNFLKVQFKLLKKSYYYAFLGWEKCAEKSHRIFSYSNYGHFSLNIQIFNNNMTN